MEELLCLYTPDNVLFSIDGRVARYHSSVFSDMMDAHYACRAVIDTNSIQSSSDVSDDNCTETTDDTHEKASETLILEVDCVSPVVEAAINLMYFRYNLIHKMPNAPIGDIHEMLDTLVNRRYADELVYFATTYKIQ